MTWVGLAVAVYLLALALFIRRRERKSAGGGVPPPPADPDNEVCLPFGSDTRRAEPKRPAYGPNIGWE